ncbi:hypothetical protein FXO37_19390 [Capsicum annuum]|nr:hypothetical protein FXO37_19390 [Capsicum annuum]
MVKWTRAVHFARPSSCSSGQVNCSGNKKEWDFCPTSDLFGSTAIDLIRTTNKSLVPWTLHGANNPEGPLASPRQVDDTIGVLARGRYYRKESVAAVTLGMGINAAYIESAQSVVKWPDQIPKPKEIAINIQWGNFRSSLFPIIEFDTTLIVDSSYPSSQIFEKLISDAGNSIIVTKAFSNMLNLANLAEEVQIAYRQRIYRTQSVCGAVLAQAAYFVQVT